jgi:hypothetical protein
MVLAVVVLNVVHPARMGKGRLKWKKGDRKMDESPGCESGIPIPREESFIPWILLI